MSECLFVHPNVIFVPPITAGNKCYPFETSYQVLTSIGKTRLTPYFQNSVNPMLFMAQCLQSYVVYCLLSKIGHACYRCENQCVNELGFHLCFFCCLSWTSMCNMNMPPMVIEHCLHTIKSNVSYQNNSFHIWQW